MVTLYSSQGIPRFSEISLTLATLIPNETGWQAFCCYCTVSGNVIKNVINSVVDSKHHRGRNYVETRDTVSPPWCVKFPFRPTDVALIAMVHFAWFENTARSFKLNCAGSVFSHMTDWPHTRVDWDNCKPTRKSIRLDNIKNGFQALVLRARLTYH